MSDKGLKETKKAKEDKDAKVKIEKRDVDFSRWYTDVIASADFADYSPVKGCMVIKPYGYAFWESYQRILDKMFKDTGHENAYFPVFIPESFLKREAEHVEGFSPELAVVTHAGGKKLEEALVVRPTSETIMYDSYSKWVKSWRDLPILINQWANVVRWEMRTRLFLRTTEFLWQEGHTAHRTHEESLEEVLKMLNVYKTFAEEYLAIPVLAGIKSQNEKFAGALNTYAVEAMMQDKKALQCGTSHDLGQNFAKAFNIQFQDKDNSLQHVWQTSWGVSTRLIGAMIMCHGDDFGIVAPPRVAPIQAVLVPIWNNDEEMEKAISTCNRIADEMKKHDIRVKVDSRDNLKPAWKYYEWERKGVPVRIEIGPKDMQKESAVLVRRDVKEKIFVQQSEIIPQMKELLDTIHNNLFNKALKFREENTFSVEDWDSFTQGLETKGGFFKAPWCGCPHCEKEIKEKTLATIRILEKRTEMGDKVEGNCFHCGKPATAIAILARAY